MAWLTYTIIPFLLVQIAVAKPPVWPSIPTTDKPCVRISETLGEIINDVDTVPSLLPRNFVQLMRYVTKLDISDPIKRERVICSLEGINSLSDIISVAKELQLDNTIIKSLFDLISYELRKTKLSLQKTIEKSFVTSETDKIAAIKLIELIKDLEAFGILGLDPIGEVAVQEILLEEPIDIQHAPVERPSKIPLEAQCSKLTSSLHTVLTTLATKSWTANSIIHSPGVSHYLMDLVTRWSKIVITDEKNIKPMVCDLLAKVQDDGLDGLYIWTKEVPLLKHILKTGYPYIQDVFVDIQYFLSTVLTSPHSRMPHTPYKTWYPPTWIERTHDVGSYHKKIWHGIDPHGYDSTLYDNIPEYSRYGYKLSKYEDPSYIGRGEIRKIPKYGVPDYESRVSGYEMLQYPEQINDMLKKIQIVCNNMKLLGLFSLHDDIII